MLICLSSLIITFNNNNYNNMQPNPNLQPSELFRQQKNDNLKNFQQKRQMKSLEKHRKQLQNKISQVRKAAPFYFRKTKPEILDIVFQYQHINVQRSKQNGFELFQNLKTRILCLAICLEKFYYQKVIPVINQMNQVLDLLKNISIQLDLCRVWKQKVDTVFVEKLNKCHQFKQQYPSTYAYILYLLLALDELPQLQWNQVLFQEQKKKYLAIPVKRKQKLLDNMKPQMTNADSLRQVGILIVNTKRILIYYWLLLNFTMVSTVPKTQIVECLQIISRQILGKMHELTLRYKKFIYTGNYGAWLKKQMKNSILIILLMFCGNLKDHRLLNYSELQTSFWYFLKLSHKNQFDYCDHMVAQGDQKVRKQLKIQLSQFDKSPLIKRLKAYGNIKDIGQSTSVSALKNAYDQVISYKNHVSKNIQNLTTKISEWESQHKKIQAQVSLFGKRLLNKHRILQLSQKLQKKQDINIQGGSQAIRKIDLLAEEYQLFKYLLFENLKPERPYTYSSLAYLLKKMPKSDSQVVSLFKSQYNNIKDYRLASEEFIRENLVRYSQLDNLNKLQYASVDKNKIYEFYFQKADQRTCLQIKVQMEKQQPQIDEQMLKKVITSNKRLTNKFSDIKQNIMNKVKQSITQNLERGLNMFDIINSAQQIIQSQIIQCLLKKPQNDYIYVKQLIAATFSIDLTQLQHGTDILQQPWIISNVQQVVNKIKTVGNIQIQRHVLSCLKIVLDKTISSLKTTKLTNNQDYSVMKERQKKQDEYLQYLQKIKQQLQSNYPQKLTPLQSLTIDKKNFEIISTELKKKVELLMKQKQMQSSNMKVSNQLNNQIQKNYKKNLQELEQMKKLNAKNREQIELNRRQRAQQLKTINFLRTQNENIKKPLEKIPQIEGQKKVIVQRMVSLETLVKQMIGVMGLREESSFQQVLQAIRQLRNRFNTVQSNRSELQTKVMNINAILHLYLGKGINTVETVSYLAQQHRRISLEKTMAEFQCRNLTQKVYKMQLQIDQMYSHQGKRLNEYEQLILKKGIIQNQMKNLQANRESVKLKIQDRKNRLMYVQNLLTSLNREKEYEPNFKARLASMLDNGVLQEMGLTQNNILQLKNDSQPQSRKYFQLQTATKQFKQKLINFIEQKTNQYAQITGKINGMIIETSNINSQIFNYLEERQVASQNIKKMDDRMIELIQDQKTLLMKTNNFQQDLQRRNEIIKSIQLQYCRLQDLKQVQKIKQQNIDKLQKQLNQIKGKTQYAIRQRQIISQRDRYWNDKWIIARAKKRIISQLQLNQMHTKMISNKVFQNLIEQKRRLMDERYIYYNKSVLNQDQVTQMRRLDKQIESLSDKVYRIITRKIKQNQQLYLQMQKDLVTGEKVHQQNKANIRELCKVYNEIRQQTISHRVGIKCLYNQISVGLRNFDNFFKKIIEFLGNKIQESQEQASIQVMQITVNILDKCSKVISRGFDVLLHCFVKNINEKPVVKNEENNQNKLLEQLQIIVNEGIQYQQATPQGFWHGWLTQYAGKRFNLEQQINNIINVQSST